MIRAKQTRRQFLQKASIGVAASLMAASNCSGQNQPLIGNEWIKGKCTSKRLFELGLASYTLREFNLDKTLAMTQQLGLKYIALKSIHLPLESTQAEIETVTAKVRQAGLNLYGGGVIYMNNEAEVHRAFDYAKAAAMKVIIGVPKPELLSLVNKKVEEYDINVAIHNHGPEDKVYPTPRSAYERIKELDGRIGLCIDIGHTQRAGIDPSEAAEKFADRLLDVHIKDVSAATVEGTTVEIGRGVIDIPKFVRSLLNIKYTGITSFEYEKDAKDPLPGVAESVGYVRGVLATI
ncbi:MAG: sugar phosphate isomerase/epimerase [Planctomycetota bacterium]|nr:MAG: sugar phosphate isomerase/epimerase [Planctomycetota bacterium]